MIKLEVDGSPVTVKNGSTVIQAVDILNIQVPRFCYHERLRVAGNCRICLVEVIGSPKLVTSCAMPASNGMKIFTSSPMVKKARESVIELLRANHPLDCPICDQGGECDLQDQSMLYGSDRSRIYEVKRRVEDKYLGPLVKIVITRCIHCTRCIRFSSEVAGLGILGTSGRGSNTEVGTYVERVITSERSGNLIDRCPVGALTSKQIMFKARSWELDSIDTYDDADGLISSMRMQLIGNTIYRAIPRKNDDVNAIWLGDKSRFMIDSYSNMRATRIIVRVAGSYNIIDNIIDGIEYVGAVLDNMINPLFVVSSSIDVAIINVVKKVYNILPYKSILSLGYSNKAIRDGYKSEFSSIKPLISINTIDIVLLLGADIRNESAVSNVMLRNSYINGGTIISFGTQISGTYPMESIIHRDILSMYNGTSIILDKSTNIDSIAVVMGTSCRQRDTINALIAILSNIYNYMTINCGLNITHITLHTRSNTLGSIITGIPGYEYNLDYNDYSNIVNVGALNHDILEQGVNITHMIESKTNILLTPWFDTDTHNIYEIVMPIVTNYEQESLMVNTEGRFNIMKKTITGVLTTDTGSVNSIVLSSLFLDGEISDVNGGDYYYKRVDLAISMYESLDNDSLVLNVPAVHDYYIEGHSGLPFSGKMVECSVNSRHINDNNY